MNQKSLRLTLYSGIALIVISILFLGRDMASWVQVAIALATPGIFYLVGSLVYRYLRAPLAAPGIVATGAWLVAVELIHFRDQMDLMPDTLRSVYWFAASILAAGIITWTGWKARIWLLVPLVPLMQLNAIWAVMDTADLRIEWWAALTFALVLIWWEAPRTDHEWQKVYRVSAVLLEVFLLLFSYWLPAQTHTSLLVTWAAAALLVTILGFRHGWVNLGPLSIVLLACALAWGLPVVWWPPVWLGIGIITIVFIERLGKVERNKLALEMSTALAILLSGAAALLSVLLPFFGGESIPTLTALVVAGSGCLMIWIGWRRALTIAEHAGLWLFASAWAGLYFIGFHDSGAYGLWMSILAVVALAIERMQQTFNKQKQKDMHTIRAAVMRWPLADLVIGLTAMIVIWSALNISSAEPWIIAVTTSLVIGVWITAGMLYRLPILLHVALWLAPLPYALLLILTVPALRHATMIGLAWQLLAVVMLLIGHGLPRYRPAMQAPFFITGYILLGLGLTLTLSDPMILLIGLLLIVIVSVLTSAIVIVGAHPFWNSVVVWMAPPEQRPYAYKHIHNAFLFLAAWLLAIWLCLMLGYTEMPVPRQGLALVLFSTIWLVLGRLLPRLPGVVGWPVYAAGWFMWLTGLLLVFFSPTEAMFTAVVGLALSGEALYRSKEMNWLPVFILQVLFIALQIAWMLSILSGYSILLGTALVFCIVGMIYGNRAGQITAITSGTLAILIWPLHLNPLSTAAVALIPITGLIVYRRWEYWLALFGTLTIIGVQCGVLAQWQIVLFIGEVLIGVGVLLGVLYRADWAGSFFVVGGVSTAVGMSQCLLAGGDIVLALWTLALVLVPACFALPRIRRLPYIPVGLVSAGLVIRLGALTTLSFHDLHTPIILWGIVLALGGLILRLIVLALISYRIRALIWWLRPLLIASGLLSNLGAGIAFLLPLYGASRGIVGLNFLLSALTTGLVFYKTERLRWLFVTLFVGWIVWVQVLISLDLNIVSWSFAPFAILLLAFARRLDRIEYGVADMVGISLLLGGAGVQVVADGLLSLAAVVLMIEVIGLVVYGYGARRRIPLVCGVMALVGGICLALILLNPWLLALVVGVMLIAQALILEVRRDWVERQMIAWRRRLQE